MITLQETRPRGDRDVPMILKDGALYDAEFDRFFSRTGAGRGAEAMTRTLEE